MNGDVALYRVLEELNIKFDYLEHPPVPTVEEARKYWAGTTATHCKNLFFRNHKGNRHYLAVLEHHKQMSIHAIERQLKQGRLSFASEQRMQKYLGVKPGSVSPFGLLHDKEKHVTLFLDDDLRHCEKISFHPNLNTASLIVAFSDFLRFLEWCGNEYAFIRLTEESSSPPIT